MVADVAKHVELLSLLQVACETPRQVCFTLDAPEEQQEQEQAMLDGEEGMVVLKPSRV